MAEARPSYADIVSKGIKKALIANPMPPLLSAAAAKGKKASSAPNPMKATAVQTVSRASFQEGRNQGGETAKKEKSIQGMDVIISTEVSGEPEEKAYEGGTCMPSYSKGKTWSMVVKNPGPSSPLAAMKSTDVAKKDKHAIIVPAIPAREGTSRIGEFMPAASSCVHNKKKKQCNFFPCASEVSTPSLMEKPESRPKASKCLNPTQDRTSEKKVSFFRDTSEFLNPTEDCNPNYSNLWHELREISVCKVIGRELKEENIETWYQMINDNNVINYIKEQQEKCKYDYRSVRDLVRLIRNMRAHYWELTPDVKRSIGDLYKGFDSFFTSRFPNLLIEVFKAVRKWCKEDEYFCRYFTGCSCS